jgi:hypothetical protein
MKNTKFTLLLGLITDPTVSQDEDDGRVVNGTKLVNTTFLEALKYPELVMAMFEQLDPEFINGERQLFITEVVYDGTLFRMIGTYDQWRVFFSGKWEMLAGWGGCLMSHN